MKDPNDNYTWELNLEPQILWSEISSSYNFKTPECYSLTSLIAYKDGILYQASQNMYDRALLWNRVLDIDDAIKTHGGKIHESI